MNTHSPAIREALALNNAARALYGYEAERDGRKMVWEKVAQGSWEVVAAKVIAAYKAAQPPA